MPDIDLDAIKAALVPQYDQYGRGSQEWHDSIEVRARLEWLPALVAEVKRLRKRAAQLSLERAEFADEAQSLRDRVTRIPERTAEAEAENERLRAVAEAAKEVVDAEYAAHSDPYEVGIKIVLLRDALDALDAGGEES